MLVLVLAVEFRAVRMWDPRLKGCRRRSVGDDSDDPFCVQVTSLPIKFRLV